MGLLEGPDQRAEFCRALATMVGAGMTLVSSLQALQERPLKVRLRQFTADAVRTTAEGKTLSSVTRRYPDLFSPLVVAMVEAGERGGRLDEMLSQVADYMEREQELRRTISRETFYPKILLAALILIPLGAQVLIAWFTVSLLAALLLFIKTIGLGLLIAAVPLIVIIFVYRQLRATEQGAEKIDEFKVSVPVLGTVIRKLALSKFARALSAGYRSGVPFSQTVTLAGNSTGNRAITAAILKAVPEVEKGLPLSQSLANSGLIDPMVLRMLQTGEDTGNVDEMMDKVADHFEAEAETSIRKATILIVPITVIIFGGIVLYMTASFYLGHYGAMMEP